MEVFRITSEKYANSLQASGRAGRWNLQDQNVLYTSSSRSLATLELLVNRAGIHTGIDYKVMVIAVPDYFDEVTVDYLPGNWRSLSAYPKLQKQGSNWYLGETNLLLKVPSAVIPQEYNFLINTTHPEFNKASIVHIENYFWDERL